MTQLRDTEYARELARAIFIFHDSSEARLERLYVKERQQEELRFSWWKNGGMVQRPLDLTEKQLLSLLKTAIQSGDVLSDGFRKKLFALLKETT